MTMRMRRRMKKDLLTMMERVIISSRIVQPKELGKARPSNKF